MLKSSRSRHPECVRAPGLVRDRLRVDRSGHWQLNVRAKPAYERVDVPIRGVRELRGFIDYDRFGRWRARGLHGRCGKRRGGWPRWRGSGAEVYRRGGRQWHRSVRETRSGSCPGGSRGRRSRGRRGCRRDGGRGRRRCGVIAGRMCRKRCQHCQYGCVPSHYANVALDEEGWVRPSTLSMG